MDVQRITEGLARLFETNRVVFWQDQDGEFTETVAQLDLSGIEVVKVAERSPLEVKFDVELERPADKFLLYATGPRPQVESDWLLDIRHYAEAFSADRASMIVRDFGLVRPSLREHLVARSRFFASRDRIERLARLVEPNDGESDIDLKIMSVLAKADQWEFQHLLMVLFDEVADARDLDIGSTLLSEFDKYSVADTFWSNCRTHFGFEHEEPTLGGLLIRLLVSDFGKTVNGSTPVALKHLMLPARGLANAVVFLDRWRDSAGFHQNYDVVSALVAERIDLERHLDGLLPEVLKDSKTFLVSEKAVARQLTRRVVEAGTAVDEAEVASIASLRQNAYWADPKWGDSEDAPRQAMSQVYEALVHASQLLGLLRDHPRGFDHITAEAFWRAYETDLYRFDQRYRLFCEAADKVEPQGWDILKSLRGVVEDAYCNGYVAALALSWGKHVEKLIAADWRIDGVDRQARFFNAHVAPHIDKDRRIFVIISDAFRYEAGVELEAELNGRYRLTAKLSSQLSVLPSYTALGMASLLPHARLSMGTDGVVSVDGKSSAGLDNRSKILSAHHGVAVRADDLMAMRKDAGRAFLEGKQVIYVYHNVIDQTADAGNEDGTFAAVRKTIDDIAALVRHIMNNLNGTNIVITADHGFLFQETAPSTVDRNTIETKPANPIVAKKRYVIGSDLGDDVGAWHGKLASTSNFEGATEFWVPKGTNRFHFVGGARFVHGGAMLQEVCVPVIKVRQQKDVKAKAATRVSTVGVTLITYPTKITTPRQRISLLQTEAVSDRKKAATVRVGIYADEQPISSVETVSLDSTTQQMNEDWKKDVWLTLANRSFDKSAKYSLIVRDAATDSEVVRQDVSIDLAFTSDF